jgi:peptidylprolyl isomerase
MKRFCIALSLLTLLTLSACKNKNEQAEFLARKLKENERIIQQYIADKGLQMQKTENGIYYLIEGTPTSDEKANDSLYHHVFVQYETYLLPYETLIDERYKRGGGDILRFPYNTNYAYNTLILPIGISQMVDLMKPGQSGIFLTNYLRGYGERGTPFMPPYSPIRVDLELKALKTDAQLIDDYIARKAYSGVIELEEGVKYLRIIAPPNGAEQVGDSVNVVVDYTLRSIEDKTYDSNSDFRFFLFPRNKNKTDSNAPISRSTVIEGWQIGVSQMHVGERGILFIPSSVAYGKKGSGAIPPYEPLIFEIAVKNRILPE